MGNNRIEIVRGTTNAFGISVTDKDGNPFQLEAGQSLVFGLKRRAQGEERVLIKTITNTIDGEYYLELQPDDTCHLEPGLYFYDVGLQHGKSIFYNVIEQSDFVIKPNVTKCGDCS